MFCRIQNLHISQTYENGLQVNTSFVEFKIYISLKHEYFYYSFSTGFCRIQNLHISQTLFHAMRRRLWFCRIQNLHISQTILQ